MSLHLSALGRTAAPTALGGALVIGTAATASAHVTVHPDSTQPGGYAQLTFRGPTASATASTTELVVNLPQDTPLARRLNQARQRLDRPDHRGRTAPTRPRRRRSHPDQGPTCRYLEGHE